MANLHKIRDLSKSKKISLKSLAGTLGCTEAGFHKMIREDTMTAVNLEKVARALGVNICVFFDCDVVCQKFESVNIGEVKEDEITLNGGHHNFIAKDNATVDNKTTLDNLPTRGEDLQKTVIKLQEQLIAAHERELELLRAQK